MENREKRNNISLYNSFLFKQTNILSVMAPTAVERKSATDQTHQFAQVTESNESYSHSSLWRPQPSPLLRGDGHRERAGFRQHGRGLRHREVRRGHLLRGGPQARADHQVDHSRRHGGYPRYLRTHHLRHHLRLP